MNLEEYGWTISAPTRVPLVALRSIEDIPDIAIMGADILICKHGLGTILIYGDRVRYLGEDRVVQEYHSNNTDVRIAVKEVFKILDERI
jgi:hypothetical protein